MKQPALVTLLAAGILASAGAAFAAVAESDVTFMNKAAIGGMAEVRLGRMAEQQAHSQAVKDFGHRMVQDHSKANDELKQLAAKLKVKLPQDIDAKHKDLEAHLKKLSGDAFDKAYMTAMVEDHEKDVAEFRHEAQTGKTPEVKAWAAKTLPTLESHLQQARAIVKAEHLPAHH